MKKILILPLVLMLAFFSFGNELKYEEKPVQESNILNLSLSDDKWEQEEDYTKYIFPKIVNSSYTDFVEVPEGKILEIFEKNTQLSIPLTPYREYTRTSPYKTFVSSNKAKFTITKNTNSFHTIRFQYDEDYANEFSYENKTLNLDNPNIELRFFSKDDVWSRNGDYLYLEDFITNLDYRDLARIEQEYEDSYEDTKLPKGGSYSRSSLGWDSDYRFNKIIEVPKGHVLEYLNDDGTYSRVKDANNFVFIYFDNGMLSLSTNHFAYDMTGYDRFAWYSILDSNKTLNKKYLRYYQEEEIDIPDNPNYSELKDLPKTDGKSVGNVRFIVDGFNMDVAISYKQKVYYLNYKFAQEQDMSIFETIESKFLNINNPEIIINHSDRPYLSEILSNPEEKATFVPHTIWNLTTNKLDSVLQYSAHAFIKQNEDGVLISYVYIDEYIIDDMISADLSWTSRTRYDWINQIIYGTKFSDWKRHKVTYTNEQYLKYRDLSMEWELYVPVWNLIRGIYQVVRTYEMPRIQAVELPLPQKEYNITQAELEKEFRSVNPDFDKLNANPRYKVWAFALEQGVDLGPGEKKNLKTQFYHNKLNKDDPNNIQLLNFRYETNGRIYEGIGNDVDLIVKVPEDLLPPEQQEPDLPKRTFTEKAMFIGITAVIVLIANGAGFFKDKKRRSWAIALKIGLTVGAIFLLWTWFINFKFLFKVAAIVLRL